MGDGGLPSDEDTDLRAGEGEGVARTGEDRGKVGGRRGMVMGIVLVVVMRVVGKIGFRDTLDISSENF